MTQNQKLEATNHPVIVQSKFLTYEPELSPDYGCHVLAALRLWSTHFWIYAAEAGLRKTEVGNTAMDIGNQAFTKTDAVNGSSTKPTWDAGAPT